MNATTEKKSGVRVYTAQEMRARADYEESANANTKTAAMLRQAADDMEREKKYEYSQRRYDMRLGIDVVDMLHCSSAEGAIDLHCRFIKNGTIVRREVGEWEEAPNEE